MIVEMNPDEKTLKSSLKRRSDADADASSEADSKKQRTVEEPEAKKPGALTLSDIGFLQAGQQGFPREPQGQMQAVGDPSFLQAGRQGSNLGDSQGTSPNPNFLMNDQIIRAEMELRARRNVALMAALQQQQQQQQRQQQQALWDMSLQGQLAHNMDSLLSGFMNRGPTHHHGLPSATLAHQLHQEPQISTFGQAAPMDVNAVLRHLTWPAQGMDMPSQPFEGMARASVGMSHQGNQAEVGRLRLPPCDEGLVRPHREREKFPLGVDEDPNWLSEFHCFVRFELVEICRASHDDCKSRNNATSYQQVGIRCRFCAHRPPTARGCRSSAYPSSIRQIYQSFTMMLRDHFGNCEAIPDDIKQRFLALKDKPSQGATDSKRYWIYSAMKAGLADSSDGIIINHNTMLAGMSAPPFGNETPVSWQKEAAIASPLVVASDSNLGSPFLRCLLAQAQLVQLRDSERIGNRRSLEQGLPGFSCRFCWGKRRLGLCRMFPARRRTLAQKLTDLHDHLRRCQATPDHVKEELERHQRDSREENIVDSGDTKVLLDRVWLRLGHGSN